MGTISFCILILWFINRACLFWHKNVYIKNTEPQSVKFCTILEYFRFLKILDFFAIFRIFPILGRFSTFNWLKSPNYTKIDQKSELLLKIVQKIKIDEKSNNLDINIYKFYNLRLSVLLNIFMSGICLAELISSIPIYHE